MKLFRVVLTILSMPLLVAGAVAPAAAQTNDEVPYPQLQWNFSTPGARANGMGGSFIGLADDATATITNPAGLINITRPQVYAEYKNTQLKTDRLATLNSLTTLVPTTFESTVNSLSFFSISVPIRSKLAAAFTIHRFLDYHEESSLDTRLEAGGGRLFPIVGTYEFAGTTYGGSFAYRVTQQLRVGLTVGANVLEVNSDAKRYDYFETTGLPRSPIYVNEITTNDTQTAASASIGVQYRFTDMVSAGFDYERSPKFNPSVNKQVNNGFRTPNPPGTAGSGTNLPPVQASDFPNPQPMPFNVPDRFGFGVAVRPNGRLMVTADAVRVMYSSLTKNITVVFFPTRGLTGNEYSTPDVTEFHAGAEYNTLSIKGNPLFVRAGVFTSPNHQTTFTGTSDKDVNDTENAIFNLLPGKAETRGTIGVGIALAPRAQIDAAYVFGREFVLSAGVRF